MFTNRVLAFFLDVFISSSHVLACFLQVHRDFRKPLIVMSPKNLLRHKDCKSDLSEFDDVHEPRFKRLLKDDSFHLDLEEGVRRLILCSGKVCL